ncbi:hypothetical protein HPB48_006131 [Haemaphysalis longicornis]|uniref:Endonuclease-reverse transcriptase n=1 Tax=Haemaphysalis longicornis TaxID=44386 RepID=A0A9J6GUB2_HAELO|nr:hypothetical protein HPB48_006131 [Haemaphysalis longicornis]
MKVDDLENRSRRKKLIIFGIKEADKMEEQFFMDFVSKTLPKDKLNIGDVAIKRIHRIGKRSQNKCRPVILKYVDGRGKGKILKNCFNLKGTGFSVSEDFSPRVRQIRKNLWDATKQRHHNGDKIVHSFDKIKIKSKLCPCEDTLDKMVPLNL